MVIISNDKSTNYRAIPCALHSEYEWTILQKKVINICWKDMDGISHQESLLPYDLQASKGEEFLLAKIIDDSQRKIRLDYIVSMSYVDSKK